MASSSQSQNSSSIISSIYKSRKTVLELMEKQGYNVDEYSNFGINEVNSMKLNNQLDMLMENPNNKRKIYIRYYLQKTIRPQNIQEMIDDLFNLGETLTTEDSLMIIVKDDINETITNLLKHIWNHDKIYIVVQNIKRLQFNIMNHVLVPPHRVLSDEEVDVVKRRYNIKDNSQFPDISRFDPVAQVIGIRPGQLCEIIRPSKTAIYGMYYRLCI